MTTIKLLVIALTITFSTQTLGYSIPSIKIDYSKIGSSLIKQKYVCTAKSSSGYRVRFTGKYKGKVMRKAQKLCENRSSESCWVSNCKRI